MTTNVNDRRAKKSIQLRLYNERRVLQALRRMGSASKAEIARYLNLTNAAMGSIVTSLEENDLVYFGEKKYDGGKGQPATMIHLNGEGVYSIGVQLDRNKIDTILIDFDGNIISRITHEQILPKPEKVLEIVSKDIEKTLKLLEGEKRKKLAGIGLAIPYNLDSWTEVLDLPKDTFIYWKDYKFSEELQKKVNIPVYQENDGTSAAISALYYGVGREINDFLYLYIGPGIGGGLVLNGEIVRGENNNAADVASMPIPNSKLKSNPRPNSSFDIMMNRASLNVLIRHLKYNNISVNSLNDLEQLILSKNVHYTEWLDDTIEALTHLIWSSTILLDISTVVIASAVDGGLPNIIKERLDYSLEASAPESCIVPKIKTGKFGSDAGTIGAASLPIFYSFSPSTEILM
ncbi:ROK family transcriptional regulator [Poseidonibacter ostreae]|uniref:ROK family protein n=1 Tax=Poseidonibacter ostreae TaxID=2654171 RepID=A0A6L4WPH7_9BACT|nr:ROK family transcriptional regulator [Poseidonibacter ostreae]KAB7885619.1 ROK family protein [Poseidonibacter ostreae]KAB7888276.1 ROK family protein [Poseidonibacter ostreae]KAB7889160.1 ROK family protein [Poseidonibacter ostreae]